MVSRIHSVVFQGIEARPVEVEVHTGSGLPSFSIVGLADKTVAESRERVRAALSAVGLGLPPKRIVVNLSPADVQKEGSHFDLAIAVGLLVHLAALPKDELERFVVLGELSLDGRINAVTGVLPAALAASAAGRGVLCPAENGSEAQWGGDLDVLAPAHLLQLLNHYSGRQLLNPPEKSAPKTPESMMDFRDVRGQESARRALEIAAAGRHNILMNGPPGAGKSMLAKRLPGILPPLSPGEMLEVSMIHSLAGTLTDGQLLTHSPYRDPHHSCSMPAMVGGGTKAKPGEVTLAHHGVLFLDELPEYPKQVLESLRQPIENGTVSVARVQAHVTYPARFQLVAAMNPCRCGYMSDPARACSKAPKCGLDYQAKLSGPLLDRFDMLIEVPAVTITDYSKSQEGESSASIAKRVRAARDIQAARYKAYGITTNSEADGEMLMQTAAATPEALSLLHSAAEQTGFSMRAYHRILRVARSIADLAGHETLDRVHMAEALGYRHITGQNMALAKQGNY